MRELVNICYLIVLSTGFYQYHCYEKCIYNDNTICKIRKYNFDLSKIKNFVKAKKIICKKNLIETMNIC